MSLRNYNKSLVRSSYCLPITIENDYLKDSTGSLKLKNLQSNFKISK